MRHKKFIYIIVCCFWGILLQGCAKDESADLKNDSIAIPFEITAKQLMSKSFDSSHTVNRIMILPFKKTNEAATNDDANFAPDFAAAKQLDINSFPTHATMLTLSAASSYKVMVIGYNRNDYDLANPVRVGTRFGINSALLSTVHLSPTSPTSVPEFFTCVCSVFKNESPVSNIFMPQKGIRLSGGLERLVSGLSLQVTNIPAFVDSVTLVAEQLVTAIKLTDRTPTLWQTAGDAGNKQLGRQKPTAGAVSFNTYLLPTLEAHKTKLYLDIHYGTNTERYTVKVNDVVGVSSANSITFMPNQVVDIVGNYNNINIGFLINSTVNLEDDNWDGLQ